MGKTLTVQQGAPLAELLFPEGVEFPCGGKGRCKGCRIKVVEGTLSQTPEDRVLLTERELAEGWRLACRANAEANLKIELAQWEAAILADDSVVHFTPRWGLGVAVDLGTTTLVAQLLDLKTGHVLAVATALNAQAQYGADIMSRVEFATTQGGLSLLAKIIRQQIGVLIEELVSKAPPDGKIRDVVVVGNTVMHHLFCGLSVSELAQYPFEPTQCGLQLLTPAQLGWAALGNLAADAMVQFLPCLGGFVGSDILAGVLATRMHESDALHALVDLGTNGEIVVGNRQRMLCASTAAGPAFEGARISMGMRAVTGAISEVHIEDGRLVCRVLGHATPRGLCGSGLVDAVAAGLDLGLISPSGRMMGSSEMVLMDSVRLTQGDVRETQLAKGAIAAGLRILVERWGATSKEVTRVYLAGAFGNYINRTSARRIGMINYPREKVQPSGNTALLGAKIALAQLPLTTGLYQDCLQKLEHVALNADPQFHEVFMDEMQFPR